MYTQDETSGRLFKHWSDKVPSGAAMEKYLTQLRIGNDTHV